MATSKSYKRNDTGPPITITCMDGITPANLTGATQAKFLMGSINSAGVSVIKAQGSMAFDSDRTSGRVTYTWTTTDLDTAGDYKVEVEITFSNGTKQTFPSASYLTVSVVPDVG